MKKIHLQVNGVSQELEVKREETLLHLLRQQLGLTGTKQGCGKGVCGSCVVLVDGKPVRSCRKKASLLDGAEVTTVEGLQSDGEFHPLQEAFVRHGAVQCGYCTPGMLMEMVSFLRHFPHPTERQIREALKGHLCRCTGYQQIVEAVLDVSQGFSKRNESQDSVASSIGGSPPKPDAWDKVTGKSLYTADIPLTSPLFAAVVRSDRPHARIVSVHVPKSEEIEGLVRVFTSQDIPGENAYGKAVRDQPVLCEKKVRFVGDPVALVVAETEEEAREAASRVHVVYEELDPCLSPLQALDENAEPIHEKGNIAASYNWETGDVENAFKKTSVIVENYFETPRVEHGVLEQEAALAYPEEDVMVVVGPTQNVFFDRREIAHVLGLERDRIRVVQPAVGASFGKREDLFGQILCALAAYHLKRAVRMNFTREESFAYTTKRHPFKIWMKLAAQEDGILLALDARILADTGAYASWAPNIIRKAASLATGPYFIPNVHIEATAVYTNQVPSGAMRGYGAPQVAFACESQVDELARQLGMDPMSLRRKNALREGVVSSTGQAMTSSVGLLKTMEEAERAAGPKPERGSGPRVRGRGAASILYGIGYGHGIPDIGSAIAELSLEGKLLLRVGCVDYGQGAQSVLTQIAGEVLGVPPGCIQYVQPDTQGTPDSGSTVASRQTYMSGNAVKMAFDRLRQGMLETLSTQWDVSPEEIHLSSEGASTKKHVANWKQVHHWMKKQDQKTSRQARFRAESTPIRKGEGKPYWPYAFATHIADVLVDTETGEICVERIIAAHDVGKAIHRQNVRGQILGGVSMGLGFALWEDFQVENGVSRSLNFDTYRIPRAADMPEIIPLIVEEEEPTGPFGAKGVGEPPTVAVAPAVANAVRDAIGIRVTELPLTPKRILQAFRTSDQRDA